jgi:hypothetical protein
MKVKPSNKLNKMAENLEQKLSPTVGQIVQQGLKYNNLTKITEEFAKNPSDYNLIGNYALLSNPGLDENMFRAYLDSFKKASPAVVRENMDISVKINGDNLAELVKASYKVAVDECDEEILAQAAYFASGADKEFEKVQTALKEGKTMDVRKKYMTTFKDANWAHFVATIATDDFIKVFAPMYFKSQEENFQEQFKSTRKVGDKEEPYLDKTKVVAYLDKNLADAKDDKAKSGFYTNLGKGIANAYFVREQMAKMRVEAEEKAKAEAEKKAKEAKGKEKKNEDKPKK